MVAGDVWDFHGWSLDDFLERFHSENTKVAAHSLGGTLCYRVEHISTRAVLESPLFVGF